MTSYHRFGIATSILGVVAIITWTHVRGDGSKKSSLQISNGSLSGKIVGLEEDLAHSKFSEKRVLTYKKQDGQEIRADVGEVGGDGRALLKLHRVRALIARNWPLQSRQHVAAGHLWSFR